MIATEFPVGVTDNEYDDFTLDYMINRIKELPDDRLIDREIDVANLGIHNELPKYYNFIEDDIPQDLIEYMHALAPKHHEYELDCVIVNKYFKGNFIPRHFDENPTYLYFCLLMLGDTEECLRYYKYGKEFNVPDKKGRMIYFNDPLVEHEVLPITDTRYVVIFFYS